MNLKKIRRERERQHKQGTHCGDFKSMQQPCCIWKSLFYLIENFWQLYSCLQSIKTKSDIFYCSLYVKLIMGRPLSERARHCVTNYTWTAVKLLQAFNYVLRQNILIKKKQNLFGHKQLHYQGTYLIPPINKSLANNYKLVSRTLN